MKKFAIILGVSTAFILPAQSQTTLQGPDWSNSYAQAQGAKKKTQKAKQRVIVQQRVAAPKPCAAYYWGGCLGWDPDPHVRAMIRHDSRIFDD